MMKLVGFVLSGILCAGALAQDAPKNFQAMSADEATAVLKNAEATTFEKAKACQRLAVVGGKEAVPVLVDQLAVDELNSYARSALEAIPDPAADDALRDAAKTLTGRQLAGVLSSLGKRRDEDAVELLDNYFYQHDDINVRSAAAVALGSIGTEAACEALQTALIARASAPTRGLGEASLACAERLASTNPSAAIKLYDRLIRTEAPKPVRLAAVLGRVRLQNENATWLLEQLQSEDPDYFNLGLAAARQMSGDQVTAALVAALPSFEPERRALVLRALGDRGDPPALPMLVVLSQSESAVRAAAVDVMAKLGTPEAAAELINIAFGEGKAAPLALDWLKTVRSDVVDRAIAQRASLPVERTNVALIELIGARRITALTPHLVKLTSDGNPSVRRAALSSLGQVGDLGELEILIERALGGGLQEEVQVAKDALRTAALRLSDRDACAERLAKELSKASSENKAFLLQLLREMGAGSQVALSTVASAAKADDPALKESATRELGAWPTADAADALLDLAKNDAENKYRVRALRGYIRIARQLQLSEEDRLRFFHTTMDAAQRDEERRLALDILTRIPSASTLELATSYLDKPELAPAAAEAAVTIAATVIANDAPAVAKAMAKVRDAKVSAELTNRAAELFQRAGGGAP